MSNIFINQYSSFMNRYYMLIIYELILYNYKSILKNLQYRMFSMRHQKEDSLNNFPKIQGLYRMFSFLLLSSEYDSFHF